MKISPENYHEEDFKGKTQAELMTIIRGLKKEIGHLKDLIEAPNDWLTPIMNSSEYTRIIRTRKYLEKAKQAYVKVGGTYVLSKSEKKAADFEANLDAICKITFSIGGFFEGHRIYIVELAEELKIYTKLQEDDEPFVLLDNESKKPLTKNKFIAALKDIQIGEWRREYTLERFGCRVLDGTQWELKFKYNNGHKERKFYGNNSYPYNFNKFQMLFGIDKAK